MHWKLGDTKLNPISVLCVPRLKRLNIAFFFALVCVLCGIILRLICLVFLTSLFLLTLLVSFFLSRLVLLPLRSRFTVTWSLQFYFGLGKPGTLRLFKIPFWILIKSLTWLRKIYPAVSYVLNKTKKKISGLLAIFSVGFLMLTLFLSSLTVRKPFLYIAAFNFSWTLC